MSSIAQLIDLYQEWGQWSALEHEALQKEDWKSISECQSKKELLQERITACANVCSLEQRSSPRVKEILSSLISAQLVNKRLLEKIRGAAHEQRLVLSGVARNLRRIHNSYGHQPSALWQSYS
jgi:tRNA G18 (ribose-2'-O)-methylase SpoU